MKRKLLLTTLLFTLIHFLLSAQTITTVAGNGIASNTGNGGPALSAGVQRPSDVFVDAKGNLYITCSNVVRKIDAATGIITHIAGDGVWLQPGNSYGDGGPAILAGFSYARSVCADTAGNVYIADYMSNNIRKVDAVTGIITTIAGRNNNNFYSGDGGPALDASFGGPTSIVIDKRGNLYIANTHNNRIRKIDAATGIIQTVAGNGTTTFSGDGGLATNAGITAPGDVYVDMSGNIYLIEATSGITCRVRRVDAAAGIIRTLAGNGVDGFSGDGGPAVNAMIHTPAGVCVDRCGNVYISTNGDARIRKVDAATGIITTIVGNGQHSFSGDDGQAVSATLNRPIGLDIDSVGSLFIADNGNHRIRKVTGVSPAIFISAPNISICEGSSVTFTAAVTNISGVVQYQWKVNGQNAGGNSQTFSTSDLKHNDVVECELTLGCGVNTKIRSNTIQMAVTASVLPTISLSSSPNTTCGAGIISLNAVTTNIGVNPVYQWKKNGSPVGSNSPSFASSFAIDDIVVCELTSQNACGITTKITSDPVTLRGRNDLEPEVTIAASETIICPGTSVTFTATNKSGTSNATYSWLINGTSAGVSSMTFTTSALSNGTKVECIMTVPICSGGTTKDYSDPITIAVLSNLDPSIIISASTTEICRGTAVTFTATITGGGTNPVYQWKVKGNNVGNSSPTYQTANLMNNDVVNCILSTGQQACSNDAGSTSNNILVKVADNIEPIIGISVSDSIICEGTLVNFTASASGYNSPPVYQWYLNGSKTGNSGLVYSMAALRDGDKVHCVLEANTQSCQAAAVSNLISMTIKPLLVITLSTSASSVMVGQQVDLLASVRGDIASFQWTPAVKLLNPSALRSTTVPLLENTTFRITVTGVNGCSAESETTVTVMHQLLMPNSFTPNRDGLNDVFRIPPGVRFNLKEFAIYDRWGNCVFRTNDIKKGWDGKVNGVISGNNTYVYIVKGTNDKGNVTLKGTVTLIR